MAGGDGVVSGQHRLRGFTPRTGILVASPTDQLTILAGVESAQSRESIPA
jgi:hypothetical protein